MTVVRYREENGKISRKHGNTLIQILMASVLRRAVPTTQN